MITIDAHCGCLGGLLASDKFHGENILHISCSLNGPNNACSFHIILSPYRQHETISKVSNEDVFAMKRDFLEKN